MAKAATTSAESARMAHGRESVRKGFAEGEAARTQAKQATAETLLQAAESDESKAAAAKKLAEARLRAEGTETRFHARKHPHTVFEGQPF
ncbi:hypothetical protein DIPPA_04216 [Diplonema papillatum]|nr:hypothetical protein DIPPA_04216 [Diplonema papillatum]